MSQIKIESNLPIIFLTLMVISITIFMIFEFKKINSKINKLVSSINTKEENKIKENNEENVEGSQENVEESQENVKSKIEQWNRNNDIIKQSIINEINEKNYVGRQKEENERDESPHEDDGESTPEEYVNNNNIYSSMLISRGFISKDENNIDIEEIVDGKIDEDKENNRFIDEESEGEESEGEESEGEESEGEESEGEESEGEESEGEESEGEESDSEGSEEDNQLTIDLKDIKYGDDFDKETISVDESYSVSSLKQICKNLGLSVSGNKTTLISRIMENQK